MLLTLTSPEDRRTGGADLMSTQAITRRPTMDQTTSTNLALPEPVQRRGIKEHEWRTLANNLFPGASATSVLMVWDYCVARKLDPLKKPCHIVPMEVKKPGTNEYVWRDVVMPGIYEYRMTAQRTGEYLGHDKPVYGSFVDYAGVSAPEWCEFTVYRWNGLAQAKIPFTVCVWFREVVAMKNGKANSRWGRAPIQMLTKCAEAAALREAFPDELGGEQTAEEMADQRAIDVPVETKQRLAKPEGYDDWLLDLRAVADEGEGRLTSEFEGSAQDKRLYLTTIDTVEWESLKMRAAGVEVQS